MQITIKDHRSRGKIGSVRKWNFEQRDWNYKKETEKDGYGNGCHTLVFNLEEEGIYWIRSAIFGEPRCEEYYLVIYDTDAGFAEENANGKYSVRFNRLEESFLFLYGCCESSRCTQESITERLEGTPKQKNWASDIILKAVKETLEAYPQYHLAIGTRFEELKNFGEAQEWIKLKDQSTAFLLKKLRKPQT